FTPEKLDLQRDDEFGQVNRAFAQMAQTQQNYSQELENEVRQRTAELERVNEQLRQDILARQKAERDKAKLEDQLRQTQKMEALGTLAGGIAHDFNNLLMPILCLTELAANKLDKEHPSREMLDEVLRAAHRARDLVAQILAFSRPGKQKKQPINLSECLRDTMKLVRAVTGAGISIRFDIDAEDLWIHGNTTQMQQMLLNLCTNAAQAMGDKGTLEVQLTAGPNDTALLTVRDDGPGMSEEVRRQIFDPFFTTKPTGKGTGMGLAVVHGIIQHHNGSIDVTSAPGQGACFTITLPRCCLRVIEKRPDQNDLPGGTERILVVDDEKAILQVWEELLAGLGYRVTCCSDPEEALKRVDNSETFDLLITDQNMPHLSGSELALKIRCRQPDIPVIVCTGYSEHCTEADARLLG
ncbi:MAG: response regulator, partial [Deltaproteobacteria bacterium]